MKPIGTWRQLKCYYMQDRIGEEFEEASLRWCPSGLFVALDDVFVEGNSARLRSGGVILPFDDAQHALVGEALQAKRYRLSDRVRIQLVRSIWRRARLISG